MKPRDPATYPLLQSTMSALDLLQQLVGGRRKPNGKTPDWPTHPWWITGTVPTAKILRFVEKMDSNYAVLATPRQKSAARALNAPTTYLVIYPRRENTYKDGELIQTEWLWDYALVSSIQLETAMRNAHKRKTRLTWQHRFELILDQHGWTWQLTPEERARVRDHLLTTIHTAQGLKPDKAAARIHAAVQDLLRLPRYRGIREQVIDIRSDAYRAIRRDHSDLHIYIPSAGDIRKASKRGRVPIYESRDGHPTTLGAWLDLLEKGDLPHPNDRGGTGLRQRNAADKTQRTPTPLRAA